MMEGDVLGRMRLDIADVQHKLGQVERMMRQSTDSIQRMSARTTQGMTRDTKNFMHVSREASRTFSLDWWKRFGEVAIGFTIAYRAMRAVETAMVGLVGTFKTGLEAIDEFRMGVVSIAASLQMLTAVPSTKSLEAYMAFGEKMFRRMEILAIQHFATGEQLQMAFTKMVTLGIVPMTEAQLEGMAALVDRILMATKGLDAGRQIMTEIQAVVEGMQRPGAVVARELKSLVPHYKELIKAMMAEPDIAKRTKMFFDAIIGPLTAVSSVSGEILQTHQAWIASLKTAGTILIRAGLDKMYVDIRKSMEGIVKSLIDADGLTERGLHFAYLYHATWEMTKTAMAGVRDVAAGIVAYYKVITLDLPIISNALWGINMTVRLLTHGLMVSAAILDEIIKTLPSGGDFMEVSEDLGKALMHPAESLKRLREFFAGAGGQKLYDSISDRVIALNEKLNKSLLDMYVPGEFWDSPKYKAFTEKFQDQYGEIADWIKDLMAKLQKGAKDISKSFMDNLVKTENAVKVLQQTLKDLQFGKITPEEVAGHKKRLKIYQDLEKVPVEMKKRWLTAQLTQLDATASLKDYLDVAKEVEKAEKNILKWYESEMEEGRKSLRTWGDDRQKSLDDFNTSYAEMGKTRYEIEKQQLDDERDLWEFYGFDQDKRNKIYSAKYKKLKKEELTEVAGFYQGLAGNVSSTFLQIAQAGGEQSKKAFKLYQAFAIVEAMIGTSLAITKTLGQLGAWGIPVAITIGAMGAAQIAMILAAKPPSYDKGGVNLAPGLFYSGVPEAHIPLKDGSVPVEMTGGGKPIELTILNVPTTDLLDQYMASARGQDAIINVFGSRPQTIKRVLRSS